jgi:hypothetical protein
MNPRALGFVLIFSVACGAGNGNGPGNSDGGGGGNDGGNGGGLDGGRRDGSMGPSGGGTCCLNGSFYDCTTSQAFMMCAGFDVGACLQKCAPSDFNCQNNCFMMAQQSTHDPSACNRDPSRDGQCMTTMSCITNGVGQCQIDADCGLDRHCTKGQCFNNQLGVACDIDADCSSLGHCTQGCCYSSVRGSPCDIDADCSSQNCTNGVCQ